MSLLEQDETVTTVLSEQLARVRGLLKDAEWYDDGNGNLVCPHCAAGFYVNYDAPPVHKLDCPAFTPSGIPK